MEINIKIIGLAQKNKPSFASPCNNCGWCCMTEVCAIGKELGAKESPCSKLRHVEGKYICSLAAIPEIREALAVGKGCDAKTQNEIIEALK